MLDEEIRPETIETFDLRGDIGFLIKDEVEAIEGYDKILGGADLTEEQRGVLQEIRNDELDHVNKLNKIYKTLATGKIEEDNELIEEDRLVEDNQYDEEREISKERWTGISIEKAKELLRKHNLTTMINSYDLSQNIKQILLSDKDHKNTITLKYDTRTGKIKSAELNYKMLDRKSCNDEITGAGYKEANVNEPLNPMCDEEVEDGFLDNVLNTGLGAVNSMVNQLDEDTTELELEDDLPVEQQIKNYLRENGNSIGRLKLVGVSKPEIEVYLDNNFLGKWNKENKTMNDCAQTVKEIMEQAREFQETLKDTDTVNDIGFIEVGNQFRWEEKYGNALLTVVESDDDEIKLALDRNGAYVEIPREKFEQMIRSGKLKATETLNIKQYGNIETLRDYKVKVGDKTFYVSAKSAVDAKNKIKSKLGG